MSVATPTETLKKASDAGLARASSRTLPKLIVAGILAGAYIALGGVLSIVIGFGFPDITSANPGMQRLLSGLVFPIGLMLVVVLGADLFTGNNALLMPPLLERRIGLWKVLSNWTVIWLTNFAGCLLVAYFLVYLTGLTSAGAYASAVESVAMAKVSQPFGVIFLKGIGANWCVCLAVWLALSGRRLGEKLLACEIPVMAFVALGFEHAIANMFFIPLGMMQGAEITVGQMLWANLLPATLGNIAGGALFVGIVHYYLNKKIKNLRDSA